MKKIFVLSAGLVLTFCLAGCKSTVDKAQAQGIQNANMVEPEPTVTPETKPQGEVLQNIRIVEAEAMVIPENNTTPERDMSDADPMTTGDRSPMQNPFPDTTRIY